MQQVVPSLIQALTNDGEVRQAAQGACGTIVEAGVAQVGLKGRQLLKHVGSSIPDEGPHVPWLAHLWPARLHVKIALQPSAAAKAFAEFECACHYKGDQGGLQVEVVDSCKWDNRVAVVRRDNVRMATLTLKKICMLSGILSTAHANNNRTLKCHQPIINTWQHSLQIVLGVAGPTHLGQDEQEVLVCSRCSSHQAVGWEALEQGRLLLGAAIALPHSPPHPCLQPPQSFLTGKLS